MHIVWYMHLFAGRWESEKTHRIFSVLYRHWDDADVDYFQRIYRISLNLSMYDSGIFSVLLLNQEERGIP